MTSLGKLPANACEACVKLGRLRGAWSAELMIDIIWHRRLCITVLQTNPDIRLAVHHPIMHPLSGWTAYHHLHLLI